MKNSIIKVVFISIIMLLCSNILTAQPGKDGKSNAPNNSALQAELASKLKQRNNLASTTQQRQPNAQRDLNPLSNTNTTTSTPKSSTSASSANTKNTTATKQVLTAQTKKFPLANSELFQNFKEQSKNTSRTTTSTTTNKNSPNPNAQVVRNNQYGQGPPKRNDEYGSFSQHGATPKSSSITSSANVNSRKITKKNAVKRGLSKEVKKEQAKSRGRIEIQSSSRSKSSSRSRSKSPKRPKS